MQSANALAVSLIHVIKVAYSTERRN